MSAVGDEDVNVNENENENEVGVSVGGVSMATQQKRRWIKYYCEECKEWERQEMFEVAELGPGAAALWSFGCSKLVRHATFLTIRVEHLNNADGHDAVPELDFPNPDDPPSTESVGDTQPRLLGNKEATEEVSALPTAHAALQSEPPKRNAGTSVKDDLEENKNPKRIKITDITWMSVQELKDALRFRGLSRTGNRAKLVERPTEALKNDSRWMLPPTRMPIQVLQSLLS